MKILVCIATSFEGRYLFDEVKMIEGHFLYENVNKEDQKIDLVITGVGGYFTIFQLQEVLSNKQYDLAINLGINGAYDRQIRMGEVLHVISDQFADFGVEDKEKFLSIFDAGFMHKDAHPFKNGKLNEVPSEIKLGALNKLKKVSAITSSIGHGRKDSIERIVQKFNPDVESMEGAAFFYVCSMKNIPCLQIRAVSNYVEPRNIKNWETELALFNLKEVFISLLQELK